jgi:hypothetical protein
MWYWRKSVWVNNCAGKEFLWFPNLILTVLPCTPRSHKKIGSCMKTMFLLFFFFTIFHIVSLLYRKIPESSSFRQYRRDIFRGPSHLPWPHPGVQYLETIHTFPNLSLGVQSLETNHTCPNLSPGVQSLETIHTCPYLSLGVQSPETIHTCPNLSPGVQSLETIHTCPNLSPGVQSLEIIHTSQNLSLVLWRTI